MITLEKVAREICRGKMDQAKKIVHKIRESLQVLQANHELKGDVLRAEIKKIEALATRLENLIGCPLAEDCATAAERKKLQ